jgi:hypothetical protein
VQFQRCTANWGHGICTVAFCALTCTNFRGIFLFNKQQPDILPKGSPNKPSNKNKNYNFFFFQTSFIPTGKGTPLGKSVGEKVNDIASVF